MHNELKDVWKEAALRVYRHMRRGTDDRQQSHQDAWSPVRNFD